MTDLLLTQTRRAGMWPKGEGEHGEAQDGKGFDTLRYQLLDGDAISV